MKTRHRTAAEITRDGFAALCDKLGMADAIRFVQLFDLRHGDYTSERSKLFEGEIVSGLVARMRRRKRSNHKKR